tara:strand:- start:496 stop:1011 length:516 start_codon:yes stop_codon:yes gene_type:complete
MNVKWNTPLKEGQRANPVIEWTNVHLSDDFIFPTDEQLLKIFKTKGYKLQTWGRSKDEKGRTNLTQDPHWIAVRNGTPLHYDPRYPRYSHHLKIRVDDGIFVRGMSLEELKLERGTYYVLDAHSPHQVFHKNKEALWNVAISVDSNIILPMEEVITEAIEYGNNKSFIEEE